MAPIQEAGVAYLGTMGWSYSFWAGKLYPKGTKTTGYLAEYAKTMNSVEVDATFYRIPSISTVEAWRDSVSEAFRFAVKFPQAVTHVPKLAYDAEKLAVFLKHIESLSPKLGPLLLQFPPFLKPVHATLEDLLEALPRNRPIAAEFRNKHWFTENTYKLLHDHSVSLVLTNKAESPNVETSDFAYLRLEGDRKAVNGEIGVVEIDRSAETGKWAGWVRKQLDYGKDVYGYISKYYSGYPPTDVTILKKNIGS